jgi:hypothetical protein
VSFLALIAGEIQMRAGSDAPAQLILNMGADDLVKT